MGASGGLGIPLRVIIDGPRDPRLNMAIDEAIARLRHRTGYDTLRVYMWSPSGVSIGRRQRVGGAVRLEGIEALGYKLVRRPTGGAALLHAEGRELTYSVVLSSGNPIYREDVATSASIIAGGVAEAIRLLGGEAAVGRSGRGAGSPLCYVNPGSSDVLLLGRKVSGSAQRRDWGSLLQHGTMLLEFEPEEWLRVIEYSGGPGDLRGRVVGVRDVLGEVSVGEAVKALVEGMVRALRPGEVIVSSLTSEELDLALSLYSSKYNSDRWNLEGVE